jgi:hypothetical protein
VIIENPGLCQEVINKTFRSVSLQCIYDNSVLFYRASDHAWLQNVLLVLVLLYLDKMITVMR